MASTKEWGRRAAVAGLWMLIVLELLSMVAAGASKFQGDTWPNMFVGWGYTAWFAYLIGAAEVGGGVLLAVSRLASYAGLMLIAIMLGAIWTVIQPGNTTGLGWGVPVINIVVLAIIAAARWSRRWTPA